MSDTIIGVPTSPAVAGGPSVAATQDTATFVHQVVVLETQEPGADPTVVSSVHPLPINIATGAAASGTAGTPSADVISIQGETGMTPVQTQEALATSGGASYFNQIMSGTPAVATVKAGPGNVYEIIGFNDNATPVYLKLYDTVGAPTLGTIAATYEFMIPGNTGGAGFVIPLRIPRSHAHAIYCTVTNGIGFTDNNTIVGNSVIVDISFN